MMRKILAAALCVLGLLVVTGFKGETTAAEDRRVDVDLTQLSSTMVYAQVFDMLVSPDTYVGKTIRMRGTFTQYRAAEESPVLIPGRQYFACVITDALACCSQGIDFELAGSPAYPQDYPAPGSEITVVGEFRQADKDGYSYIYVADARLE